MAVSGPVYYHGYGRDERALTGIDAWDNAGTFVSHDPEVAALYGPKVDRIEMHPDTRVHKLRLSSLDTMLSDLQRARDAGADVAEFHPPKDFVGHIILNPARIARREPYSPDSHRTAALEGPVDEEPEYYHVSPYRLPAGTMLRPGFRPGNWDESKSTHNHVTPSQDRAEQYHYMLWDKGYPEQHVYHAVPHGPLEPDPDDSEGLMTKHPVEITGYVFGTHENEADNDDEGEGPSWFRPRTGGEGEGFRRCSRCDRHWAESALHGGVCPDCRMHHEAAAQADDLLGHFEAAAEPGHETWYHLTDNPHFALDPEHEPEDNALSIAPRTGKGIYLTKSPEGWLNGHGYVRPYVAEFHARPGLREHDTHGRWGGEMYVPAEHYGQLHLHRVIPLDAHAREEYGAHGWIEQHHGTEFDTGEPLRQNPANRHYPFKPGWNDPSAYRYPGPDVRDMPIEEHARHRDRWLGYMRENRGWDDEGIADLRQAHDSHRTAATAGETGYGASRRAGWPAHWTRPPERRTGRPGEFMYRFQGAEFHDQTMREGIAPRRSAGHLPDDPDLTTYMTSDDHVFHARPESGHPGTPEWLQEHGDDEYHRHYKIDVSGLPLVEDRTYTNPETGQKRAWMATGHIGPERIQPHLPGSEHGVTYDLPGGGTREWLPPKTAAAEPEFIDEENGPFYHGTRHELQPGAMLTGEEAAAHRNYPHIDKLERWKSKTGKPLYMSANPGQARYYADTAHEPPGTDRYGESGRARVYEVEPTGFHMHDPENLGSGSEWGRLRWAGSRITDHPLRVIREVPEWGSEWGPDHEDKRYLGSPHGWGPDWNFTREEYERFGEYSRDAKFRRDMGWTGGPQRAEAASRPARGEVSCSCCSARGEHSDGSHCGRCEGSGFVSRETRDPHCPGQPAPKRRRRKARNVTASAEDGAMTWYHGSSDELAPGDAVRTAAELGRPTRGGKGDEHRVWVSDDPIRAGAYGVHIYEVRPHDAPVHTRGPDDEHGTSGATVVREVPYHEARQLSPSYREQAGAYERRREAGRRRTMVPVQHILDHVRPGDYRSWPDAFRYIESEHVALSPEHWGRFLDDVQQRGITTPSVIYHGSTGSALMSGHHRVWAAHKLGIPAVPAWETDDEDEASRLTEGQAKRECDWLKRSGAVSREAAAEADPDDVEGDWGWERYTPSAERTESVRHILSRYQPEDFDTWDEVRDNLDFTYAGRAGRLLRSVREHGVRRPIPIDYEQDPPRVMNGHTRLIAAERAGIEHVPTRQHQGFMDPDDPDPSSGDQPYDRGHWTNKPEWQDSLRAEGAAGPAGEELLGHFEAAGDYQGSHTAPNPAAGHLPLHHYTGGDPDDQVRIYRAVPHGTESINSGDWVSLSADYAHGHGRHATDSSKDWPVLTAEVPAGHVHWDENDENEHGYNGPDIHHPDVHDEETGGLTGWDDWHEAHPHGQEAWAGASAHLSPEDHEFVHDDTEWEPDRADRLLDAARAQGSMRGARWRDDLYDAMPDAEAHAAAHPAPEGRRLTSFTVHRNDQGEIEDVGVHHYRPDDEDLRRYRFINTEGHGYEHPAIGEVGSGPEHGRREAALEVTAAAIPEYGPQPEMDRERYEREGSPYFYQHQAERHAWTQHIRRGLSLGHLTPGRAKELGYYFDGSETDSRGEPSWQPLPEHLYHVTTSLPGVRANGLRSREELEQINGGHGLGGGSSHTISMTSDHDTARSILRALHEFHDVVNRRYTPEQMWEEARAGTGAQRPFHDDLAHYWDRDHKPGDPLPDGLKRAISGTDYKREIMGATQQMMDEMHGPGWRPVEGGHNWTAPKGHFHNEWEKPMNEDDRRRNDADFYKTFAAFREHAGGHQDPLFFGTDEKSMAALDPRNFAIVHVRPKPGAQGYPMGALHEWRTGSGDALETHRAERLEGGHLKEASVSAVTARYEPGLPNPHTGGHEWFHGTQAPEEQFRGGFDDPADHDPEQFEIPEGESSGTWSRILGNHFAAAHDVARHFAEGEHSSSHNDWYDDAEPAVVHARLQIRNPKRYASEFDLDSDAYEHAWRAGNHPHDHLEGDQDENEEMWPSATHLHRIYGDREIPKGVSSGVSGIWGVTHTHPDRSVWLNSHPDRYNIAESFKRHLMSQGYDGIVYGNEIEHSDEDHPHADTAAIAFHPRQIEITKHHDADDTAHEPELNGHLAALEVTADDDREPVDLYRGLYFGQGSAEDADELHRHPERHLQTSGGLGIHWTRDPTSAYNFATDRDPDGWAHEGDEDNEGGVHGLGMILHARVHPRHIIEPGTPEWEGYSAFNAVLDPDHAEQETTVRDGAPVRLHKIYAISEHEGNQRETEHPQGRDHVASVAAEPGGEVVAHFEPPRGPFHQQKLFHMQPDPRQLPEDSTRHNPADPMAMVRHRQETEEGYVPPRETWDHPEYGNRDEESGLYRHPGHGGYHCHACTGHHGEAVFHDDPDTAEAHNTAMTDWDEAYDGLPDTIHRGLWMGGAAHHLDQGGGLTGHLAADHILHLARPFGTHWSTSESQARHYSGIGTSGPDRGGENLNVVIHARKPDREDIETDPEKLGDLGVYGLGYHDDEEIPLKEGAPVHVLGVSWRRGSDPHGEWQRHDFPQTVERTAALEAHPEILAHFEVTAASNPPCRLCGEPLDDQDVADGASAHDECAQLHWCEAHQEEHDDPVTAENHNNTYTDWGMHLPFAHGIHRGFPVQLPDDVHRAVHDESRPAAERAEILRRHLDENPSDGMGLQRRLTDEERYGGNGHFGVHWTDSEQLGRAYGEDDYYEGHGNGGVKPYVTHVVLHAASPAIGDIEHDPDELDRRHMWGFDHPRSEREVPLRVGAPVHLTGLSWKRGGETEWRRHDFPGPVEHTAALEATAMDDNGDRYVTCDQGHQHWGAHGAAGLLIRHRGDDGGYRYLLQHRSPHVQHGDTWSTPGGALRRGETPEAGAVREAEEEFGPLPEGLTHHHTFTDDHGGGWAYHTVVMDAPHRFTPRGGDEDAEWESEGHRWVTPEEMHGLDLHPGFAASWDRVRKSGALEVTAVSDGLPYVPPPPEGELREHMHHMHAMDSRTSDLYMSPDNQRRWHDQEHRYKTWQYPKEGEVPHQHAELRGIPAETQYPDTFELSEHTDFAGGTPEHGRFERVLTDPDASRPFAPLMPSESHLIRREGTQAAGPPDAVAHISTHDDNPGDHHDPVFGVLGPGPDWRFASSINGHEDLHTPGGWRQHISEVHGYPSVADQLATRDLVEFHDRHHADRTDDPHNPVNDPAAEIPNGAARWRPSGEGPIDPVFGSRQEPDVVAHFVPVDAVFEAREAALEAEGAVEPYRWDQQRGKYALERAMEEHLRRQRTGRGWETELIHNPHFVAAPGRPEGGATHLVRGWMNGQLAGVAAVGASNNLRAWKLHRLHVFPEHREAGAGPALMDAVYDHARKMGGRWVDPGLRTREEHEHLGDYEEPHPDMNIHRHPPAENPTAEDWNHYFATSRVHHDMVANAWNFSGSHTLPDWESGEKVLQSTQNRWTRARGIEPGWERDDWPKPVNGYPEGGAVKRTGPEPGWLTSREREAGPPEHQEAPEHLAGGYEHMGPLPRMHAMPHPAFDDAEQAARATGRPAFVTPAGVGEGLRFHVSEVPHRWRAHFGVTPEGTWTRRLSGAYHDLPGRPTAEDMASVRGRTADNEERTAAREPEVVAHFAAVDQEDGAIAAMASSGDEFWNKRMPELRNRRPYPSERMLAKMHSAGGPHNDGFAYIGDGGFWCANCKKARDRMGRDTSDWSPLSWSELRTHASPTNGESCSDCMDELIEPREHTASECDQPHECPHALADLREEARGVRGGPDERDVHDEYEQEKMRRAEHGEAEDASVPPHISEEDAPEAGSQEDWNSVLTTHHEWSRQLKQRERDEMHARHDIGQMFSGPEHDEARRFLETNEGGSTHLSALSSGERVPGDVPDVVPHFKAEAECAHEEGIRRQAELSDEEIWHGLSLPAGGDQEHGRRTLPNPGSTGETAPEGHDIWAEPHGTSPVAAELYHNMTHREPGDEHGSNWYHGLTYHGPYHLIRHPETRETWLVDREGRNASPMGRSYGNWQRDGMHGESVAEEHWRGLESTGPDAHRTGTADEPRFSELMKERTPAFPHSRVDPEDLERVNRSVPREHAPEGYSPDDEYHGSYEVVRHPETGRYHVVDNAGRLAGGSYHVWKGFDAQLPAERSRDYIEHRQRSKEIAHGIVNKIWGEESEEEREGRESERHLSDAQDLMSRYEGGRGQVKFEPEEDGGRPYYEREHHLPNGKPSGWYVKHYGGPAADVYHRATGDDEAHDMLRLTSHEMPDGLEQLSPAYGDEDLAKDLHEWYHRPDGMRRYYEEDKYGRQNEPRISRWRNRHLGSAVCAHADPAPAGSQSSAAAGYWFGRQSAHPLHPGAMIHPDGPDGYEGRLHFTPRRDYAEDIATSGGNVPGWVYRVEPTGDHERHGEWHHTGSPLRVTRVHLVNPGSSDPHGDLAQLQDAEENGPDEGINHGDAMEWRPRSGHIEATAAAELPAAGHPLALPSAAVMASWKPHSNIEGAEVVEDMLRFFRALGGGLRTLAARMDDTPLDEDILALVARLAEGAEIAEQDTAAVVASLRRASEEGEPPRPEGTWEDPKD